jgi:hypothetical protein
MAGVVTDYFLFNYPLSDSKNSKFEIQNLESEILNYSLSRQANPQLLVKVRGVCYF